MCRVALLFLCAIMVSSCAEKEIKNPAPPNILLIVADDLGYTDLGCLGSEIATPNIDRLAARGTLFSRFHTGPLCGPSRAMLLTGNDNHIAGVGVQNMFTGHWGYEGYITDRVKTIPQVLKSAGYQSYMVGKWHLGRRLHQQPYRKGFEKSFSIAEGGSNHYNNTGFQASVPTTTFLEGDREVQWPEGAYSTDFFTDKMIEYIGDSTPSRPFFAYAAYTAPHWPLQVNDSYREKYEGRYTEGYEQLRSDRFERIQQLGLLPDTLSLPPLSTSIKSWSALSTKEKKTEQRKMELYAGMIDNLDDNIGRLLAHLEKIGAIDNTVIIFLSDNGPSGDDFFHHPAFKDFIQSKYDNSYENMGSPTSFVSYGAPWAEASSVPFKGFKGHSTEGGILTPLIISLPGAAKGNINHVFTTIQDIAPTIYEMAGIDMSSWEDITYPLLGTSLLPSAKQVTPHGADYVFGVEHINKAFLIKGDWKIVSQTLPFKEDLFELYNLKEDILESRDLKSKHPEKFQEMLQEWEKFAEERRIQNPYPGDEYF